MNELENGLIEQLNELGISLEPLSFEKLPKGVISLSMKDYYALDVKDKRVIFAPINRPGVLDYSTGENKYGPKSIISVP